MAASDWMRSIRGVRDTPVANYSPPSVNTMHHFAYRPLIAISSRSVGLQFQTDRLTLWPTVTIRRNGFIGYTLPSALQFNGWCCENLSSGSFYIELEERRKKVRIYNTTGRWRSTQLRGSKESWKERVRPKVGKDRMCIFVVWQVEMKMRCCLSTPETPRIYTPPRSFHLCYLWNSVHSPSLLIDILRGRDWASLEMQLETEIDRDWRCTGRPWSS